MNTRLDAGDNSLETWSLTPKFGHKVGIPSSNSRWLRHAFRQSSNLFKCPRSLGEERGDGPWIEIRGPFNEFGDKGWNAVNGKHRCQGGRHQNLARYTYSSQHIVQISKRLLPHTLTVLSVTKASSYRLSWIRFKPRQTVYPISSNKPIFPAQNMK